MFSRIHLAAVLPLLLTAPVLANPTSKDPQALLSIRTTSDLPGDHITHNYDALNKKWIEAKRMSDELWSKYEAKKLTLGDARKIGPLVLLLRPLQRQAEYFKAHGEACGFDLELRTSEIDRRMRLMIRQMLQLPNFPLKAIEDQLNKSHDTGLKRLPQIEALKKRGQHVQAEAELHEIRDDQAKNAEWFPDGDTLRYFAPFIVPLQDAINARRTKAQQELQAIAAAGPDYNALRMSLTQAATSIGATGQATWNGQSLTGPDLLADWQQQAVRRQAAAKRAECALWALSSVLNEGTNKHDEWLPVQQKFAADEPALLAAIIQASAQAAQAPDARALHQEYLPIAATLVADDPTGAMAPALESALQALAKKGGLEKDLAAYKTATEPLLGWRRFMARSQGKSLSAGASPLADWCTKACSKPQQPETIIPLENGDIGLVSVVSSTNLVLANVLPAGSAPLVVANHVVSVNPAAGRSVATYQRRVFALVGAPPQDKLQMAIAHLEQQLLVPAQGQPLSLAAAIALSSARTGSFESAGGPVEMVTCEPLLTRFMKLPDEAARLLPLGPLPPENAGFKDNSGQPSAFLTLRCDIPTPQWWQHECFVIKP